MGWDSNPRDGCPPAGFQDRCLQPLGHPSCARISMQIAEGTAWCKSGIATRLPPYFRSECSQNVVDLFSRPPLHPVGRVAVDVHGDRHAGVARAHLGDLGMDSGLQ